MPKPKGPYETVTYGKGLAITVTPKDREVDVMHYLKFGTLLGGRSLEGVEWEEVEMPDSAKALARSMREI